MTGSPPPPPPPPPRSSRRPSSVEPGDEYTVYLYLIDFSEPQVYEHVKHINWGAGNTVLVICHYTSETEWRYVYWPREQIQWYQRVPTRFRKAASNEGTSRN